MTRLTLHIGATKTGSSSLQEALSAQSELLLANGILYPTSGRSQRNPHAHHNLCYEIHDGRRHSGAYDPSFGGWDDVEDELKQTKANQITISSEAFFTDCRPKHIRRLAERLKSYEVEIVVYLRRQDSWLQSSFNQLARFGRTPLNFMSFYDRLGSRLGDYGSVIADWTDAFPSAAITVRAYDDAVRSEGIVRDFASLMPGSAPFLYEDRRRKNTKAGLRQLVAVATVVDRCREQLGEDYKLSVSSASRLSQFFNDRNDVTTYSLIDYRFAKEIYKNFAETNQRALDLADNHPASPLFSPPRRRDIRNYVKAARLGPRLLQVDELAFLDKLIEQIVKNVRRSSSDD